MSQVTDHNLDAIQSGQPFALNYQSPAHDRGWLYTGAVANACPTPRPSGQQCDEYPFSSSVQGGQARDPSLRLVPAGQNGFQGGRLALFYGPPSAGGCGLSVRGTGAPFLVVPVPVHLDVPTTHWCNRFVP